MLSSTLAFWTARVFSCVERAPALNLTRKLLVRVALTQNGGGQLHSEAGTLGSPASAGSRAQRFGRVRSPARISPESTSATSVVP